MHKNEDFFKVFGHISVFFATLDFFVTYFIMQLVNGKLLNLEKKQIDSLSDRTLGQKFQFLKKIKEGDVKDGKVWSGLQKFLDDAIKLSEKRNRFIHDQWVFDNNAIKKGEIALHKLILCEVISGKQNSVGVKTQKENYTIDQLYSFLSEVGAMQGRFAELSKSILPSS